MATQLTVGTNRLILKPYVAGFVTDQHVAWLNDAEVVRYSEQRHKTHTLETQHSYLNSLIAPSKIWLIKLRDGPDIGTITTHIDDHNARANMGVLIGEKSLWGQGHAKEAWQKIMQWLCHNGIRRIEAGCMSANEAMKRVCFASGMVQEAVIEDHFLLDGEPHPLVIFGYNHG